MLSCCSVSKFPVSLLYEKFVARFEKEFALLSLTVSTTVPIVLNISVATG